MRFFIGLELVLFAAWGQILEPPHYTDFPDIYKLNTSSFLYKHVKISLIF